MTGIEMTRRLSRWFLPLAVGVVACSGCGGTVLNDNHDGTGGVAGAVGTKAGSTSVGAGRKTGASAGGSPSTSQGSGGPPMGDRGAGGVNLAAGGAGGFGAVPPPPPLGSGGAMAVVCGANVCVPPPAAIPGFVTRACCADAFAGICGTIPPTSPGLCEPPTKPDPRCPSAQTPVGSSSGCCIDNNCGIDLSSVGLGCVDATDPMISRFLPGLTPMHCDGTPFGGTGASDAGVVKDASTPDGATGAGSGDASSSKR